MDNLLSLFQESLRSLGVTKKDRLLLAVSGGLDSVVLSECCERTGMNFGIAHANFQLRGAESTRDESFVSQLAARYQKPIFVKKFDTENYAAVHKCSIQVAARDLRYDWFQSLLGKEPDPYRFVVTAHHLDDNIETMLMHFFRGTGLAGLSGMPARNGNLIRPLLSISKNILNAFAVAHDLRWVEDSSNESDEYTRNYFRNKLMPALTSVFPDVHKNMEQNLQRFSESLHLYRQAIDQHKKKLMHGVGSEIHIPIGLLKKTLPLKTIVFEMIRDYHFSPAQADETIRLMDSTNGKYISSPSHRIIKNRRWLIIAPLAERAAAQYIIEENQTELEFSEGRIRIIRREHKTTEGGETVPGLETLDAAKITYPLIFRKWKPGDYFYPLGMQKKKKIARFLIDQKLSKSAKENVWVLIMDSQILWVAGLRIDNRFRIGSSTTQLLQLQFERKIG